MLPKVLQRPCQDDVANKICGLSSPDTNLVCERRSLCNQNASVIYCQNTSWIDGMWKTKNIHPVLLIRVRFLSLIFKFSGHPFPPGPPETCSWTPGEKIYQVSSKSALVTPSYPQKICGGNCFFHHLRYTYIYIYIYIRALETTLLLIGFNGFLYASL